MATREIQYFFHPRTGSFSYVVADIDTLEAIIIDPVADYDEVQDEVSYDSVNEIIDHIKKRHLHPMAVLETHIDDDHFSGCFYLGQQLDTPVYISTCCDEKNVPVMLDLAYINLAIDQQIDLTHKCIEYIVSSLSKVFPVELYRIGIRMQRKKFEDQLYVVNEKNYNYLNLLSAYVGTKLMEKYPADYIFKKYRDKQIFICNKLNLKPSPCVYFGIDQNKKFQEYNRGTTSNRLCFSRIWDGRMAYEQS